MHVPVSVRDDHVFSGRQEIAVAHTVLQKDLANLARNNVYYLYLLILLHQQVFPVSVNHHTVFSGALKLGLLVREKLVLVCVVGNEFVVRVQENHVLIVLAEKRFVQLVRHLIFYQINTPVIEFQSPQIVDEKISLEVNEDVVLVLYPA